MNSEEKAVLEKAVGCNEGLLSPATLINSYAGGRRKIAENLVALGYLEMVPEEITTGKVINFYRVTEKGFSVFYPIHRRLWFLVRGDVRTVIVAIVVSILTTIITLILKSFL